MARRGENIYLRKDGRYEGRYIKGRSPEGKPLYGYIYGRRYADVKRRLVAKKCQTYGEDQVFSAYGDGTLGEWAAFYLQTAVKPRVKPGTWDNYQRILHNHIIPLLGQVSLKQLSAAHVQHAVDELSGKLAPGTVQGIYRLLKTVVNAALERDMIARLPWSGVKLPRGGAKQPRVLTRLEQTRLEDEVVHRGETQYLLCLYTGLRVGELTALKWQDVDFENALLRVRRTAQRISSSRAGKKTLLSIGLPKTHCALREIPLSAFLLSALRTLWEQSGRADGYLFPGPGGALQDPRTLQLKLTRICRDIGLQGVHMHTLRHSFATRCLECGVGVDVLSALLGHSSPQITLRYYTHCTLENKRKNINRLRPGAW